MWLCLLTPVVKAAEFGLDFDRLEYGAVVLERVSLRLNRQDPDFYRLAVSARRLQLNGHSFANLRIDCEAEWSSGRADCGHGRLQFEHPVLGKASGRLAFRHDFAVGLRRLSVSDLRIGDGRLDMELLATAGGWQLDAALQDLDLALLDQLPLPGISPGSLHEGTLNGSLRGHGWPLQSVQGELRVDGLDYAAASVAQEVSLSATVALDRLVGHWQGRLDLALLDGELYVVPPTGVIENPPGIYLAIEDRPVVMETVFELAGDGSVLIVQDFDYRHPEVLQFNAAGRLRLKPAFSVDGLSLRTAETRLERAFPVYLAPWLLDTAYNDLEPAGTAALELGIGSAGLGALAVRLDGVDIVDGRDRFAVRGLVTDIQMTEERRHVSRVGWDHIDLYRIGLGAGAIELASNDLDIRVTRWEDVPLLDGVLRIHELEMRGVGTADFELHMAGAVEGVSLHSLTAALDWPELTGTLGGEFSGLQYRQGDIRMDGRLRVRMFDGAVDIDNLNVRDLFGSVPVLTADLAVRGIDLEQLTETFAFGRITGRLGGHVRDLKLENWRPVAFDARLSTLDDGDVRHRISQKALNNLSQIGGGLSGALSRGFLAYFDEYSYGELGVSCRLANGFCELGGVERFEGGHYLLTRGGLLPPWVEVKLAGSMISWEALIAGFERIARGDVEIE